MGLRDVKMNKNHSMIDFNSTLKCDVEHILFFIIMSINEHILFFIIVVQSHKVQDTCMIVMERTR